jgi:hypothetical protein
VLRRILGPKRDEVTGEWRKLHNEELRDLLSSPDVVRVHETCQKGDSVGPRVGLGAVWTREISIRYQTQIPRVSV